jgi:hypothetical protein
MRRSWVALWVVLKRLPTRSLISLKKFYQNGGEGGFEQTKSRIHDFNSLDERSRAFVTPQVSQFVTPTRPEPSKELFLHVKASAIHVASVLRPAIESMLSPFDLEPVEAAFEDDSVAG